MKYEFSFKPLRGFAYQFVFYAAQMGIYPFYFWGFSVTEIIKYSLKYVEVNTQRNLEHRVVQYTELARQEIAAGKRTTADPAIVPVMDFARMLAELGEDEPGFNPVLFLEGLHTEVMSRRLRVWIEQSVEADMPFKALLDNIMAPKHGYVDYEDKHELDWRKTRNAEQVAEVRRPERRNLEHDYTREADWRRTRSLERFLKRDAERRTGRHMEHPPEMDQRRVRRNLGAASVAEARNEERFSLEQVAGDARVSVRTGNELNAIKETRLLRRKFCIYRLPYEAKVHRPKRADSVVDVRKPPRLFAPVIVPILKWLRKGNEIVKPVHKYKPKGMSVREMLDAAPFQYAVYETPTVSELVGYANRYVTPTTDVEYLRNHIRSSEVPLQEEVAETGQQYRSVEQLLGEMGVMLHHPKPVEKGIAGEFNAVKADGADALSEEVRKQSIPDLEPTSWDAGKPERVGIEPVHPVHKPERIGSEPAPKELRPESPESTPVLVPVRTHRKPGGEKTATEALTKQYKDTKPVHWKQHRSGVAHDKIWLNPEDTALCEMITLRKETLYLFRMEAERIAYENPEKEAFDYHMRSWLQNTEIPYQTVYELEILWSLYAAIGTRSILYVIGKACDQYQASYIDPLLDERRELAVEAHISFKAMMDFILFVEQMMWVSRFHYAASIPENAIDDMIRIVMEWATEEALDTPLEYYYLAKWYRWWATGERQKRLRETGLKGLEALEAIRDSMVKYFDERWGKRIVTYGSDGMYVYSTDHSYIDRIRGKKHGVNRRLGDHKTMVGEYGFAEKDLIYDVEKDRRR